MTRSASSTSRSSLAIRLAFPAMLLAAACGSPKATPPAPTAPTLSSQPADGATNVSPDIQALTITSSKPLDASTVNATNINLLDNQADTVVQTTVTLSSSGITVTVTPMEPLAEHTAYLLVAEQLKATASAGGVTAAKLTAHFTTGARGPALVSINPADGSTGVNVTTTVALTFSEPMTDTTPSAIQLMNGATPVVAAISWGPKKKRATLTPAVSLAEHTDYTVTIGGGLVDADDGTGFANPPITAGKFTTGGLPPVVVSTSPADAATGVATNTTVTVTFNEPMNDSSPSAIALFDADRNSAVQSTVAWDQTHTIATLTPAAVLYENDHYQVQIADGATDVDDTTPLAGVTTWPDVAATFVTATTTPTVVSFVPAASATGVNGNSTVVVTFSGAMDPATIDASTLLLTANGATVPAAVTLDSTNTVATITPAADLLASTTYTATVTTGAKDYSDIALAANATSTFTTAAGPTVTGFAPTSGATAVPLTQVVTASFSAPVQGVSASTFTVADSSGNAVQGDVVLAAGGTSATFTPSSPYAENTTYAVSLTSGITDQNGNRLSAATSTFTTVANVPQVTGATIAWQSDSGGTSLISASGSPVTVTNAALTNDTITVTFDHQMASGATQNAVTITDEGGNTIASSTAVTNNSGGANGTATVVTTIPALGLASSTFTYTMAAGASGAKSLNGGTPIAAPLVYHFATEPQLSFFTIPHDFTTGVYTNQKIFVVFDKPLGATAPQYSPGAGSLKDVTLYVATGTGAAAYENATLSMNATNTIATITPGSSVSANARYTLQVNDTIQDANGNHPRANVVHAWATAAGNDPNNPAFDLSASGSWPKTGATDVSTRLVPTACGRGVEIAFTGGIDPTTAYSGTASKITIAPTGGAAVPVTVGIPSNFPNPANEIDVCPTAPLAAGTTYAITIPGTIASATGNQVQSGVNTISFTTAADAAPTVAGIKVSTSPTDKLSNAGTNTAIAIQFATSTIDPSTLNVTLTDISGSGTSSTIPVASTFYDPMTNAAVIHPGQPFGAGDTVNVTVDAGLKSANGTATTSAILAGTITIGSGADTSAIQASLANPAATGAPANASVQVTFDKEMDPATLEAPGAIVVQGGGSNAPMRLASENGTSATLLRSPGTFFTVGQTYTVVLTNLKDLAGNAYAGSSLTFTVSNTAPASTGNNTTTGSSGQQLAPNSPLTVDFGDLLDTVTVNPDDITVEDTTASATLLAGIGMTKNPNPGASTVEVFPSNPWLAGHSYTVTLGTGIEDQGSLPLANPVTISFSTASGPHIIGAELAYDDGTGNPQGGFASGNCGAFDAFGANPVLDITQLAGSQSGNSCTSSLAKADMPLFVEFDEAVSSSSATDAANYVLKDNAANASVSLSCNDNSSCTVVKLVPTGGNWLSSGLPAATYPTFDRYTLKVQNIKDNSNVAMSSDWNTAFKTVTVEFYEPSSKGSETEDPTYSVNDTNDSKTPHDVWSWFGSAAAKGVSLTPSWITDEADQDYQRACTALGGKTATMEMASPDDGWGGSRPSTDIILRVNQLYGFDQQNGDTLGIVVNAHGSTTGYALLGGGGHYDTGALGHSSGYPSGYEYDEYSIVQGAGIFSTSQLANMNGVRAHFVLNVPGGKSYNCPATDLGWLLGSWAIVAY